MHLARYIVKRLLWLIPTLIILIWLVGLLEDSMPGDPVEDILRNADFEYREDAYQRRARYNEIATDLDLDAASFYFTLEPLNLARGTDVSDHRMAVNKRQWLKGHNAAYVNEFFDIITDQIDKISNNDSPESMTAYSTLCYLGEVPPGKDINWQDITEIPDNFLQQVRSAYQSMVDNDVGFLNSLPVITWNGTENRLHKRMVSFIKADWGNSVRDGRPVSQAIGAALKWTLLLSVTALFISFAIALIFAWVASIHDGNWKEAILSQSLFVLYAIPLFWLATILIVFFTSDQYARWMDLFPGVGVISVGRESFIGALEANWTMLILPVLCLSSGSLAYFYQFILNGQRQEAGKPYFITAQSKGLTAAQSLTRHTLINSLFPVLGLMALIIPGLISGALIIEVLFNIPGMGRLMFNSILARDWNVVVAVVFLSGVIAFLAMTAVDILLHFINPKFRVDG